MFFQQQIDPFVRASLICALVGHFCYYLQNHWADFDQNTVIYMDIFAIISKTTGPTLIKIQ